MFTTGADCLAEIKKKKIENMINEIKGIILYKDKKQLHAYYKGKQEKEYEEE